MIWLAFYLGGVVSFLGLIATLPKNEKQVPVYVSLLWFIVVPMSFINLLKRGVSNG